MNADLVYTWVNAADEDLTQIRNKFRAAEQGVDLDYRVGETRFRDQGELRHSLMTVKAYLPFIRNIYVVHAGEPASWLKGDNAVRLVDNREILPKDVYPSFQSDVVEAYIHRIPGLSEHYIYANDDMFFAQRHEVSSFFTPEGRCRVAVSERLATMAPVSGTYKDAEINSVQSLQKRLRSLPLTPTPGCRGGLKDQARIRLQALKRGVRLLNTFTHVAQPYLKSRWADFHAVFAREMAALRSSKFRSSQGYATNFMYHHYLRNIGDAEFYYDPSHWYIDWRDSLEKRQDLLQRIGVEHDDALTRYCVNDHPSEENHPSGGERGWVDYHKGLMEEIRRVTADIL